MGSSVSALVFLIPKLIYDLGFSKSSASLAVSVYGACTVVSGICHGLLIDFKLITVTNLYLLSLVVCGTSVLLIPPVLSPEGQFVLAGSFGLGFGVMAPMTATMCRQYVCIDKVSNAIGFLFAIAAIGHLVATQMMGMYRNVSG